MKIKKSPADVSAIFAALTIFAMFCVAGLSACFVFGQVFTYKIPDSKSFWVNVKGPNGIVSFKRWDMVVVESENKPAVERTESGWRVTYMGSPDSAKAWYATNTLLP